MKQYYYFTLFTTLHLLYYIFLSFYLLNPNHVLYVKNETEKMKITTIPMEVYNSESL